MIEPTRRVRLLRLSWVVLPELLTLLNGPRPLICAPPIPDDLRVVNARVDTSAQTVDLLCASASFDPVPIGTIPPEWTPIIRNTTETPTA